MFFKQKSHNISKKGSLSLFWGHKMWKLQISRHFEMKVNVLSYPKPHKSVSTIKFFLQDVLLTVQQDTDCINGV